MKYFFRSHIYTEPKSGIVRKVPIVEIENQNEYGCFFYDEINNLSTNLNYIKEIVSKIEAVLSGDLEFYEGFGFEVYMVECHKYNAYVKNVYEGNQIEATIPTNEVYALMRDWRDFLVDYHNKK